MGKCHFFLHETKTTITSVQITVGNSTASKQDTELNIQFAARRVFVENYKREVGVGKYVLSKYLNTHPFSPGGEKNIVVLKYFQLPPVNLQDFLLPSPQLIFWHK